MLLSVYGWRQETESRSSTTNLIPFHLIPNKIKYRSAFALHCIALNCILFVSLMQLMLLKWKGCISRRLPIRKISFLMNASQDQIIILWWKSFERHTDCWVEFDLIWFETQTSMHIEYQTSIHSISPNLNTEYIHNQINKQKKSIRKYYFHLRQPFVQDFWIVVISNRIKWSKLRDKMKFRRRWKQQWYFICVEDMVGHDKWRKE